MRSIKLLATAGLVALAAIAAQPVPSVAEQIAGAVQAAPKDRREGAEVLGYSPDGKQITLRKGANDLICLADNPAIDGFEVDCYHKELEPFMARGRELGAQGVKGNARHEMRWKEVDEGKLILPKQPRMLYVLTGKSYDMASDKVVDSYLRWVLYTPYATPESTGLSTKSGNEPWLMYPGKAGAHIMISPPKK